MAWGQTYAFEIFPIVHPNYRSLSPHTQEAHHHSPHWYTYCPLTAASFLLIDLLLWQPYAAPVLYPFLISLRHQLVMLSCQSCILDRIFTSEPGPEWWETNRESWKVMYREKIAKTKIKYKYLNTTTWNMSASCQRGGENWVRLCGGEERERQECLWL